ncbi:CLUMA_CG005875, isoform A [Clunio marinus]|uniref:CLUMA_CG005875, isoform A n=1 Tax=Clunio marinus TaxID=568069 RepID=A0A1J1HW46_9DIPT|nr:CLUMA_CG005875, isoform A [Clunio marinus]
MQPQSASTVNDYAVFNFLVTFDFIVLGNVEKMLLKFDALNMNEKKGRNLRSDMVVFNCHLFVMALKLNERQTTLLAHELWESQERKKENVEST